MTYCYILAPTDFDQWANLHQLLMDGFAYMAGRIDPPSSLLNMTPESLKDLSIKDTLLVVYKNDVLVGCAFFQTRKNAIYVGKVTVALEHRRQGIARKIFGLATKFAQNLDKTHLELQTRVELIENHQTFAQLGFVKTGENAHAGYDRPTSITMQRTV